MSAEELSQAIKVILEHRAACMAMDGVFSTSLKDHLDALLEAQRKMLS